MKGYKLWDPETKKIVLSKYVTFDEIPADTKPTKDSGVASISTGCDTSLVFNISPYWEMVDFNNVVSSNVTYLLNTIF